MLADHWIPKYTIEKIAARTKLARMIRSICISIYFSRVLDKVV